ncbi:hypothetical protein [Alteromonas sp. 14N.309.X.WAT.G.H12]|uniref:hypothetical protein n=1 Tax=Alteromonas sp. 14N.309.X.WAT.G.H12 TaxID=3120824 RepID=UPI002FD253D6
MIKQPTDNIKSLIERNIKLLEGIPESLLSQKSKERAIKNSARVTTEVDDFCARIIATKRRQKLIRSVHHFACSGGSLISKSLDAMPSVRLLSELHPLARKHLQLANHKFTPSDVVSCAYYAKMTGLESLSLKIMEASVKIAIDHAYSNSEFLIFREHSHTDFCVGSVALNTRFFERISDKDYPSISIATVRNPIDSYLSLNKNKWVHFTPPTFDEYCKRLNLFLSGFGDDNIFFYESFLKHPQIVMKKICEILEVPFSATFVDTYDTRTITGDSGRGADRIIQLKRREISPEYIDEINCSEEFKKFLRRFKFYKERTVSL